MSDETPMDEIEQGKIELIMGLRRQGIRDKRVLSALERVPREKFISGTFRKQATKITRCPSNAGRRSASPTSSPT